MKRTPALSITRPWSELILRHGKDVENRTWTTNYRGPLLVHAAKSWQGEGVDFAEHLGIAGLSWKKADYPTGIVGLVDVVDVCGRQAASAQNACGCGPWAAHGQFHWRLANPRPLAKPVECGGRLGLWMPPAEVFQAAGLEGGV